MANNTETHKILKIYTKDFDKFTALNIQVMRGGSKTWLNGYQDDKNKEWKEGDTVDVEVWFDNDGDRFRYKPIEPPQSNRNHSGAGSSSDGQPDTSGVTNAEIKSLLIRIGKKLQEIDDNVTGNKSDIKALRASLDKTSHLSEEEQEENFKEDEDDDLPF